MGRFVISTQLKRQPQNLHWGCMLLAAITLLTCSATGLALPDDRDKPIHISADKAVRDEKNGVTIYSGNVKMRQGSMELDSDKLTIYHVSQDADKIVARGAPAKMRQRPELDEGLVHAHANTITYFRNRELVHLRVDARIEKEDGTLVTGDEIDYFIDKELVKAKSDTTDKARQIFVVIPPSQTKEDGGSDSALDPNEPLSKNGPEAAQAANKKPLPTPAKLNASSTDKGNPTGGETPSQ